MTLIDEGKRKADERGVAMFWNVGGCGYSKYGEGEGGGGLNGQTHQTLDVCQAFDKVVPL